MLPYITLILTLRSFEILNGVDVEKGARKGKAPIISPPLRKKEKAS